MRSRINICKREWMLSLILVFLLAACGTPSTGNTSPTINLTDVNSTAQSAAATLLAQTLAPTTTAIPTDISKFTPTPPPFEALKELRVVYITNQGDLYVQDSGKQVIQLTHNVKNSSYDHPPLISDDGQKIVFYRAGESNLDSVYVINADGSGEQVLVNPELISVFGKEYDKYTTLFSLAFVPGTHSLLFNTYQQGYFDPESAGWLPIVGDDLFVVNTDTGKINQLEKPWQGGNFLAAPNGKWIAVQTLDHIDVIDVEGQGIHHNLVTYKKIESHIIVPMSWTQDSKELIILPSEVPLFAAGATVTRTVWRYPINGDPSTQIKLNPPPVYDTYSVSPDGNWIAYIYATDNNSVAVPPTPFGIYLGNLHDGASQLLNPLSDSPLTAEMSGWSPNNTHFIFSDEFRMYVGNTQGDISPLELKGTGIIGWIDDNRYLMRSGILGEIGEPKLVKVAEHFDTSVFLGH